MKYGEINQDRRKPGDDMSDKQKSVSQEIADSYRQVRVMTWQPIATAPKQLTVLLWEKNGIEPAIGFYSIRLRRWARQYNGRGITPTHWMPLPEPPEGE